MLIAALVVFGLVAAGVALGMCVALTAPVGYQDDSGFHFGKQQAPAANLEVRSVKAA